MLLGAIKKYRWRVSLKKIEWNGNETETCSSLFLDCKLFLSGSFFLTSLPSLDDNKGIQSAKGALQNREQSKKSRKKRKSKIGSTKGKIKEQEEQKETDSKETEKKRNYSE